MKRDNLIDFVARRSAKSAGQTALRLNETDQLLHRLRNTKRLSKHDQSAIVGNLGRLIVDINYTDRMVIALSVLEENEYDKRKRYIRFPNESMGRHARCAASGGSFARIVDRLIQQRSGPNFSDEQARIDTVRKALKGTTFLPPSQFELSGGKTDTEAAQFAADMQKVFNKLANEANLTDFFALLKKHPIFPSHAWYQWNNRLTITLEHDPNQIPMLDWDPHDEELEDYVPWWAPRCVIGHWYIPFRCKRVRVPDQEASSIRSSLDSNGGFKDAFYDLLSPFMDPKYEDTSTVFHRLPVWLIALPQHDRLVPCLYISAHKVGGFYPNQEHHPDDGDPVLPCFVENIGEQINDDGVYLPDGENDEYNTLFVHVSKQGVLATGSQIDEEISNFRDELLFVDMEDDLPEWLRRHPVKRWLPLSTSADAAMQFALTARKFWGRKWDRGDRTIFRPAFPDLDNLSPGPSQDTIAAYLLRNLVILNGLNIFETIKLDALAKHSAARAVFDIEHARFRQAFEQRYEE